MIRSYLHRWRVTSIGVIYSKGIMTGSVVNDRESPEMRLVTQPPKEADLVINIPESNSVVFATGWVMRARR